MMPLLGDVEEGGRGEKEFRGEIGEWVYGVFERVVLMDEGLQIPVPLRVELQDVDGVLYETLKPLLKIK